jgi:hypothetical protein
MRFHETQRFRQPWLWMIVMGIFVPVVGLFGYGLWQQLVMGRPWGDRPASDAGLLLVFAFVVLIAVGTSLLFVFARLDVTVTDDAVVIRFVPFHAKGRRIALSEIADAHTRKYRPLAEYGGWGIRYGFSGMAYNVSGDEGVQLVLTSGKRILIGSQRSRELEAAIARR